VLTKEDAAEKLHAETLDSCLYQLSQRLSPVGAAYAIPPQSKAQTALAKFLAYLLLEHSGVYVYLARWSLHPFSEHLDLFYGYRQSLGETRPLSVAPVHFIEAASRHELESVLCIILFFGWDAWIFDERGTTLVRVTHDGKLEIQVEGQTNIGAFAADPASFFAPLVM
jgi:hypothetical protein